MFWNFRAWSTYKDPGMLETVERLHDTGESISTAASKVEKEPPLAAIELFQDLPSKDTYVTGETRETACVLIIYINRTRKCHPYVRFLSTSQWLVVLQKQ